MSIATTFSDFLFAYWWLLFPLGFFIAWGFGSFMRYKRAQSKIDLLKTYAAAGKEPPADLVANLNASEDRDWEQDNDDGSGSGTTPFLVILFAGLASVFAYAGWSGLLSDGETMPELYFVAAILGVLALAFLIAGLFGMFGRSGKSDG